MQLKVIIGTVAFMLTMMIMGYAVLREPARLQHFTDAQLGRSVETGAKLYMDNCATCHGLEGKAEVCYDTGGNQITCQGFPLNYAPLLCEDISQRMVATGWEGSKDQFIVRTIAASRSNVVMPPWASRYGGPMRDDQIRNVSDFVLNWQSEELCSAPPEPAYPWPEAVADYLGEYPEGDPVNGAQLFQLTYACAGCHGVFAEASWSGAGPWVGIFAENAPRDDSVSAEQYVYHSILYPNDYIVDGYNANVMPQNFALRMGDNPQDMADILAYIFGGGEGE